MREEYVTKVLLKWLLSNKWNIVCFDFPQSGTGRLLHPNGTNEKNKGAINPDIVAVRDEVCLFFENKDRFYYPDFEKVSSLVVANDYTNDIDKLLSGYTIRNYYYGIGLPIARYSDKSKKFAEMVDFIVGVSMEENVEILYNPKNIMF